MSAETESANGTSPAEEPAAPADPRSTTREYYEAILIAVIFALFVRTFVVQAFKIPSGSMEDNLLVGDHILVDKVAYAPHAGRPWDRLLPYRDLSRGDVVVFKFPEEPARDFIKRCIGLAGDVVEIRKKVVYINGRPRNEDPPVFFKDDDPETFHGQAPPRRDDFGPESVEPDRFFMMGDNRDHSWDSRFWGTVPREFVRGRALMIYWSFEARPQGTAPPTFRETVRALADVVLHFFTKTRWSRTFDIIR